ncbi:MAG TPA: hypothetical protein VFB22_17860 [Candidatus Baltobacteraceae bacterium]|nr:hypothetical protein [Candidatus Baltobacteraceae bacterium]
MDVIRPTSRPLPFRPALAPRPNGVRAPGDGSLFRGWGVSI